MAEVVGRDGTVPNFCKMSITYKSNHHQMNYLGKISRNIIGRQLNIEGRDIIERKNEVSVLC